MKLKDQIKALAELDGWQRCTWYDGYNTDGNGNTTWRKAYVRTGEEIKYADEFPNYPTSHDAIIPLIQKWCDVNDQWDAFIEYLWDYLKITSDWSEQDAWRQLLRCTPQQLAEALLRATGKWIV